MSLFSSWRNKVPGPHTTGLRCSRGCKLATCVISTVCWSSMAIMTDSSPCPLNSVKTERIWAACVLLHPCLLSLLVLFTGCDVRRRKQSYTVWVLLSLWKASVAVSFGAVCAYHCSAKISERQLVKQTLPKYNFPAYNTGYLTFCSSIPSKPKVYFFWHSALLFADKRKKYIYQDLKPCKTHFRTSWA